MTTLKDIKKSAEQTDKFLSRRYKQHIRMVENSMEMLQGNILDSLNRLSTSNGRLDGVKVNLAQMNRIHKDIAKYFENDFSKPMQYAIKEMRDIESLIEKSYAGLGIAASFSGVDKDVLKTLMEGNYRSYLNLGGQYQEKVVQQMYNQVIGNGRFSELVYGIEGALLGTNAMGVKGVPLANYAKLYARDMLFNFHQEANMMKAREANLEHFLYVGDIIETSREFCKQRVGMYFTLEEINSWTFDWPGKSGPPMIYRGGWNCRHHWQAIKPEWVDIGEGERLDIGDWDLEEAQRQKEAMSISSAVVQEKAVAKVEKIITKSAKQSTLEAMDRVYEENPELNSLYEKHHGDYLRYKTEYEEYFEGYNKRKESFAEWLEANPDIRPDNPYAELLTAEQRFLMENLRPLTRDPDIRVAKESFQSWQQATYRPEAEALKLKAKFMEKSLLESEVFTTPEMTDELRGFLDKLTDDSYLKIKAMNQAYMKTSKIEGVNLYRGIGLDDAGKIEDVINILDTKKVKSIVVKDNTVVGYTTSERIGMSYGFDSNGITVKRFVSKENILVHNDLFAGITGSLWEEREFLIFGGSVNFNVEDIFYISLK
jgi:hypothetical protein